MDVVSICPLRAGSVLWQPGAGRWTLTIVCKATYVLIPGESQLAEEQDDLDEDDGYWDDDANLSLRFASDLVPFKRHAEVLLVGNAYAPDQVLVSTLVARLIVADVDKSIAVFGDRASTPEGFLHEGPQSQFTKMPLRYERAAGGSGTSNPVGVPADAPQDRYGMVPLPNLQLQNVQLGSRHDHLDPVGFGPIAARWPTRLAKLKHHAASWFRHAWSEQPLPEDIDGAYFNAAPLDQQTDRLSADERIILENLHPQHARLATCLPNIRPRAVIEWAGGIPEQETALRCDTLTIDSARGRCSVLWRGQISLPQPFAAGRVVVSIADTAAAHGAPSESRSTPVPRPTRPPKPFSPSELRTGTEPGERTLADISVSTSRGALPFVRGAEDPSADVGEAARRHSGNTAQTTASTKEVGRDTALPFNTVADLSPPPARAPTPSWPPPAPVFGSPPSAVMPAAREPVASDARGMGSLGHFALSQTTEAAVPPARVVQPAWSPPVPVLGAPLAAVMPSTPARELGANERSAPRESASPWASRPSEAPGPPTGMGESRMWKPSAASDAQARAVRIAEVSHAAVASVAAASDAAAAAFPAPSEHAAASSAAAASPAAASSAAAATRTAPRAYIDLLWFDKDAPRHIRAQTSWLEALREPARDGDWMTADEAFEAKQEANDRRDVIRALSRVPAVDGEGVMAQMTAAIDDDGVLTRPLVVVKGELQLFFEEMETLKATIAVVSPLVGADKKLKEIADAANETASSEWRCTSAVAEGMTTRLKEAFAQTTRGLPSNYVDSSVERILLEQRRYQKRTILGSARLRAALVPVGTSPGPASAIPAYLPEHLEKELPMFQRFQVVIVAEAHSQQDQFENHAAALVVLALGRVLPVQGRGPKPR